MLAWSEILLAKDFTEQVQTVFLETPKKTRPFSTEYFTLKVICGDGQGHTDTLIFRENNAPHSITNTIVVVHLMATLSR